MHKEMAAPIKSKERRRLTDSAVCLRVTLKHIGEIPHDPRLGALLAKNGNGKLHGCSPWRFRDEEAEGRRLELSRHSGMAAPRRPLTGTARGYQAMRHTGSLNKYVRNYVSSDRSTQCRLC